MVKGDNFWKRSVLWVLPYCFGYFAYSQWKTTAIIYVFIGVIVFNLISDYWKED